MGKIKLRDYQQNILNDLKNLASIGLLMGTGTGKTFTSIFRFLDNPTDNLLIVCPHNVLGQWKDVLMSNFSNFHILDFKKSWSGNRKNEELLKDNSVNCVIVNYEILDKLTNLNLIIDNNWTIILDESHRIKDAEVHKYKQKDGSYTKQRAKTTDAVLKIGLLTPWKIILTATPTQGNFGGWIDYYSQLEFLGYWKDNFTYKDFKNRYCIYKEQMIKGLPYPIKIIKEYKNTVEIERILMNCCRYYESKFGDFEPEHTKITLEKPKSYNKVKQQRVYKDIVITNVSQKRVALKSLTTGTIMGSDYYKNALTYEDNDIKLDWVKGFLEDTKETVAIYYQYNVELYGLKKMLKKLGKKFVMVNGKTKDPYVEINKKEYDVMLGQYQSASQSLDGLQHKCHIMIFYSMPESSLLYKQSLGRINRDGQEKVPMYYYLICEKTIDEDIYTLIQQKVEFSEETLDKLVVNYI